jgi:hypothetical protein
MQADLRPSHVRLLGGRMAWSGRITEKDVLMSPKINKCRGRIKVHAFHYRPLLVVVVQGHSCGRAAGTYGWWCQPIDDYDQRSVSKWNKTAVLLLTLKKYYDRMDKSGDNTWIAKLGRKNGNPVFYIIYCHVKQLAPWLLRCSSTLQHNSWSRDQNWTFPSSWKPWEKDRKRKQIWGHPITNLCSRPYTFLDPSSPILVGFINHGKCSYI